MARQKLTPRKVIQKPSATRTPSAKAPVPAPTAPGPATFTSKVGVIGEVIRLSPGRPAPTVHLDAAPPAANGDSAPTDDSADQTTTTHVIVLPGNPGVIGFYADFGSLLCDRLPHDVGSATELHLLGLPGHDAGALNGPATFGLSDHIAHVLAYLQSRNVSPSPGKSRVVLAGHSYGFFLTLRVLESLPPPVVAKTSLVGLMPCAWRMGYCAGPVARALLSNPLGIVTGSAWLMSRIMPKRLAEYAFNTHQFPAGAAGCTQRLLESPPTGLFRNVCTLAQDEMREIGEAPGFPAARAVAGRTFLFTVDDDRWCPTEAVAALRAAFGEKVTVERPRAGETVEHAFVLDYAQCEKVARVVAAWVTEVERKGDGDDKMVIAA